MSEDNLQSVIDCARDGVQTEHRYSYLSIDGEEESAALPVMRVTDNDGLQRLEVMADLVRAIDERAPAPRRMKGTATLLDLAAFVAHAKRFGTAADSVIYAEPDQFRLTAVYNEARDEHTPAWRDHRAQYACPRSPAWLTWTGRDGREQGQEEFADFVEANLHDLAAAGDYPAPTVILQMARDLTVLTKGTYQRQVNPTTGAHTLVCKSETETGSTVIPRAFILAIPVFDAGEVYQIEARIRFTLANGQPRFSYTLHRRTEIERDAFGAVALQARELTGLPVWGGRPG